MFEIKSLCGSLLKNFKSELHNGFIGIIFTNEYFKKKTRKKRNDVSKILKEIYNSTALLLIFSISSDMFILQSLYKNNDC